MKYFLKVLWQYLVVCFALFVSLLLIVGGWIQAGWSNEVLSTRHDKSVGYILIVAGVIGMVATILYTVAIYREEQPSRRKKSRR